jgi:prepilin-type N-terminal cleavage/methylation domain-containing protein/prepilin-type processing-associated H-X9-DG protein
MPRPATRKGFSLVELLVVITIIVILISILVPSLERAMHAADKTKCLSNLRAFSNAYRLYAADFHGDAIGIPGGSRSYWNYALAPYLGYTDYGKDANTGAAKFMLCPDTRVAYPVDFATDAHMTWNWDTGQGSYGLNLFLMSYVQYNPGLGDPPYAAKWWHLKYDSTPGPTPVIGDCKWIGGWPYEGDYDPTNYESFGGDGGGVGVHMGRWAINRHANNTVNVSFVDGSARNMILGELWNVPWHRKFNPSYRNGQWDKSTGE